MTESEKPLNDLPSLNDLSIDELFQRHSVRKIQKLHSEYQSQVEQAKQHLHTLVGEKYRDLIRIAEEVDNMSAESSKVDTELTNLSYRRSGLVQFGSNAASRFEAKVRTEKAEQARLLLQTTIVNNIINNKIIGYDLKLKADKVRNTTALVHLAKLYHTVSSSFETTLNARPHTMRKFEKFRFNFIQHLEQRLASYCSNLPQGDLTAENLILHQSNSLIDLNTSEFEDAFDEDELEESNDWDLLAVGSLSSLNSVFVPQSLPIVNLFVAYILVNSSGSEIVSTENLVERLIFLRYNYFAEQLLMLIESHKNQTHNINFTAIFSFLENTHFIIHKYLVGSGFNEIQSRLTTLKSWDPATVVGFHNWLHIPQVSFPIHQYAALSEAYWTQETSPFSSFIMFLQSFMSELVLHISVGKENLDPSHKLQVFHNFIVSLKKVDALASQANFDSMVVTLISKADLLSIFQNDIFFSIESMIKDHQKTLHEDIIPMLDGTIMASKKFEPFTLEFVSKTESDVGEYIKSVFEVATLPDSLKSNPTGESIHSKLKCWFSVQRSLLSLVSPESDIYTRLKKILTNGHLFEDDLNTWSDQFFELMSTKVDKMSHSLRGKLKETLSEFKDALTNHLKTYEDSQNVSTVHFSLKLILILLQNLKSLQLADSTLEMDLAVQVGRLYQKTFDCILEESNPLNASRVMSNFDIVTCATNATTIPLAPHTLVCSMMYHIASGMLESPHFTQSEVFFLYLDDCVRDEFVKAKKAWIGELINTLIDFYGTRNEDSKSASNDQVSEINFKKNSIDLTGPSVDEEEPRAMEMVLDSEKETAKIEELLTYHARQALANIAFLLQFAYGKETLSRDESIVQLIERIKSISPVDSLDESIIDNIFRGAASYYQSGKEIYLPLLLF